MESEYLRQRRALKNGTAMKDPPKEQKPIAKKSVKMKAEDKEYRKAVALYLANPENKYCNIQIDESCTNVATCVNHTRRRGANKMNEMDWEPSCSHCNGEIENKDAWARENGHLKSKFNNK